MRALPVLSVLCTAATLMLVGCTGPSEPRGDETSNVSEAPNPKPSTPAKDAADDPDSKGGPVEAYLDWLAASRKPDAPRACALMTDELQTLMLTEFSSSLGTDFPNCEAMINATAAMYSDARASAEVNVNVVSESASEATLFSTYVESGKCGTIHLRSTGTGWILTEQIEECARR